MYTDAIQAKETGTHGTRSPRKSRMSDSRVMKKTPAAVHPIHTATTLRGRKICGHRMADREASVHQPLQVFDQRARGIDER
jgi:hypothetical protein